MANIFTPTNQKKLTNVATVRLKKAGKRFEIACYPNKVTSWRRKTETDVNEVLHTHEVFSNVSKGQLAKDEDLKRAFDSTDREQICLTILAKGELQVSEKERHKDQETMFRDIATIIAEKCINPVTNRPHTISLIEQAMKDIHYSVKPTKSVKVQALDVVKQLQETKTLDITKAQMRLRIVLSAKDARKIKDKIKQVALQVESEGFDTGEYEAVILTDPGVFRVVDDIIASETKGKGRVEILSLKNDSDD